MRDWGTGFVLLLFVMTAAQAADMRVAPTRLFFAPEQRVQDVLIANPGGQPLLVELQAFHWSAAPLEPAEEVVLSPPIVQIPPGESAVVRVGFRGAKREACETSYRLWLTEVPQGPTPGKPVLLRTRMDLPIFRLQAKDCHADLHALLNAEQHQLNVENRGNAHALMQKLTLRHDRGETPVVMSSLGYVLPGEKREFPVPMNARLDQVRWLELVVETPDKSLTLPIKARP